MTHIQYNEMWSKYGLSIVKEKIIDQFLCEVCVFG